ncbi:MAG TPA: DUF72 domain-containing protein [Rubrivivax sp.]|nr:DUF72 domain-containing protein [Rubrivivax sp.]
MAEGISRIGISGWRYEPWRGEFYPQGLTQARELAYASQALPTIEINGSFYSLQHPKSWGEWHDHTPEDFVFSVKAPKFITHVLRLRDARTAVANFFASGLLRLGAKLGPILWQVPPSLRFDAEQLSDFLAHLPHDTEAALGLAQQHDDKVAGRNWLEIDAKRPLRHALEARHASFADPMVIALLRKHRVAWVVADTAGRWPEADDVTADFVYIRLHGATALYESGYSDEELDRWAARISAWTQGQQPTNPRLLLSQTAPPRRASRDVFCYFDNTEKLHAPVNAQRLLEKLGLPARPIDPALLQRATRRRVA